MERADSQTDLGRIEVHRLGRVDYAAGLAWQHGAASSVTSGGREAIALLEHEPVYTLGARANRAHLRVAPASLPAPLVESDRGGEVTYHGPGQLVVYPVLDLRRRGLRAGDYVRLLEGAVIEAAATWGVEARRVAGRPGAWVALDGVGASGGALAKVAAIGVRVERGVSRHGLALNVGVDLGWYAPIVACGIEDAGVTSLAALLPRGSVPTVEEAGRAVLGSLGRALGGDFIEVVEYGREPAGVR